MMYDSSGRELGILMAEEVTIRSVEDDAKKPVSLALLLTQAVDARLSSTHWDEAEDSHPSKNWDGGGDGGDANDYVGDDDDAPDSDSAQLRAGFGNVMTPHCS